MEDLSANSKTSCGFITDVGYTPTIKVCMLTMKKLLASELPQPRHFRIVQEIVLQWGTLPYF